MEILALFYIALFLAIIFFGPLQEFLYHKKSEWELKRKSRKQNVETHPEPPAPADPERTGLMLPVVLVLLALAFFLWKILTAAFVSQ